MVIEEVIKSFFGDTTSNIIEENKEELEKKKIDLIQPINKPKINYNENLEMDFLRDTYRKFGRSELLKTISDWNHVRFKSGLKTNKYEKELLEIIGGRQVDL